MKSIAVEIYLPSADDANSKLAGLRRFGQLPVRCTVCYVPLPEAVPPMPGTAKAELQPKKGVQVVVWACLVRENNRNPDSGRILYSPLCVGLARIYPGCRMRFFEWVTGLWSERKKALSRYRRGMRKAREHDSAGAIEEYTHAINTKGAPTDVVSMARFNRALVYTSVGDNELGVSELKAIVAMPDAPEAVKSMARQKLFRMKSRNDRKQKDN